MDKTSVGVVLVNWNGGQFTIPCIESLLAGSIKPDRIVIVDNGSKDGSPSELAKRFPDVQLIVNNQNRGFTGGNNQGIAYLLDNAFDYIWILNNDTVVEYDCLKSLLEAAIRFPSVSGFSAKIWWGNAYSRIWYGGAYRHSLHGGAMHLLDSSLDSSVVNGVVEVPFLSGCCMFVPYWAFRKYGAFIESYVAYCEDSEWCWRVTRLGAKLYYVPAATLTHKVASSIKANNKSDNTVLFVTYLMARNQLWTVRMHAGNVLSKSIYVFFNIVIQVKNIILSVVYGRFKSTALLIKSLREGLFCGLPEDITVLD